MRRTTALGDITLALFHGTDGQMMAGWRAPDGLTASAVQSEGIAALRVVSITQSAVAARIEADGLIAPWAGTTPYALGSWVNQPTNRNVVFAIIRFECATAGTTAAAQPRQFTAGDTEPGDTVADGSVVWITRSQHDLPEGSEADAIAVLRAEGWTHSRASGRDGIIAPDATQEQRNEIDEAVLAVLRDPSVMEAAARLMRLRERDNRLQRAARLQESADQQAAAAQDLEGET
jgi:hypothetical protein